MCQPSHEVNCWHIIGVKSPVNFGTRRIEFGLGHGGRKAITVQVCDSPKGLKLEICQDARL